MNLTVARAEQNHIRISLLDLSFGKARMLIESVPVPSTFFNDRRHIGEVHNNLEPEKGKYGLQLTGYRR